MQFYFRETANKHPAFEIKHLHPKNESPFTEILQFLFSKLQLKNPKKSKLYKQFAVCAVSFYPYARGKYKKKKKKKEGSVQKKVVSISIGGKKLQKLQRSRNHLSIKQNRAAVSQNRNCNKLQKLQNLFGVKLPTVSWETPSARPTHTFSFVSGGVGEAEVSTI